MTLKCLAKGPSFSLHFDQNQNIVRTHLKEEVTNLLICFGSYQGIPYSHTCRLDMNMKTLKMANIKPICKK